MAGKQTNVSALGGVAVALRWVRDVSIRGAGAGAVHGAVAGMVSAAVNWTVADFWDMLDLVIVFGAVFGLAVAMVVGVLTAPSAVLATVRGQGRWLRPLTVSVPAVALVAVAFATFPVWPPAGQSRTIGALFENLVWWHVGPAFWAALVLFRLTRRWPS